MKQAEIQVGGEYFAKVSGVVVPVRVDSVYDLTRPNGRSTMHYGVTNLKTGRRTTFRSATKFRRPAAKSEQQ